MSPSAQQLNDLRVALALVFTQAQHRRSVALRLGRAGMESLADEFRCSAETDERHRADAIARLINQLRADTSIDAQDLRREVA